jgi:hypothetical protein
MRLARAGLITLLSKSQAATVHRKLLSIDNLNEWLPEIAPVGPLGVA